MKAQLVIAGVLGSAAALFAAQLVDRRGDPARDLEQVEARLAKTFEPMAWVNVSQVPNGVDPRTFQVVGPDGASLEVRGSESPTEDQLDGLFKLAPALRGSDSPRTMLGATRKRWPIEYGDKTDRQLEEGISRKYSGVYAVRVMSPSWTDVERVWDGLQWDNRKTAKAKALSKFGTSPVASESSAWEYRQEDAGRSWMVEERSTLWARRAGYGAAFGLAAFAATLAVLAAIAWIWRFLLARLREVSDAVRGR